MRLSVFLASCCLFCFATASHAQAASTSAAGAALPLSAWKLPAVEFPASNPFSQAKARLGKQLFFDSRLNSNHMACSSCHQPGLNFSDGLPQAMVNRHALPRQTPSLINAAYAPNFFWDGRATQLEAAINDHIGGTSDPLMIEETVAQLRSISEYRQEFQKVFDNGEITAENAVAAIATYVRTLTMDDSPFDRWVGGDKKALDESAQRGYRLFIGKASCVKCHTPPFFSDFRFHRTGSNSIDPGRFEVTLQAEDQNAFRTPPLRQVAETPPYMHAGQKATLREVLHFYVTGGERHSPSDALQPLDLSEVDVEDLLDFLRSLSAPPIQTTVPNLPINR